jgi:hypothetical protein
LLLCILVQFRLRGWRKKPRRRRPGAAHPGQGPDRAHPVGKGRDETEILSPTQRVGITRLDESVIVEPKIVSSMKMPSAWCRKARCRKSPAMLLDWSNQSCSGR